MEKIKYNTGSLDNMFRYYGFIGIILSIFAFFATVLQLNYPPYVIISTNFIGIWLFLDAIDFKLNNTSILNSIKKVHFLIVYILIGAFLISLVSELFGHFLYKLWGDIFYLNFKTASISRILIFMRAMIIGYGGPFLMTLSLYRIISHFIKKEHPIITINSNLKKIEKNIFPILGVIGLFFLIFPFFISYFSTNLPEIYRIVLFGLSLLGIWFLLEYTEYTKHKSSLLKDIMEFKGKYIISIIITSFVVSLIVECFNLLKPAWKYKNIPLSNIKLLGIPIIIIIGWIPLVIIFLSFYRALIKSKDIKF